METFSDGHVRLFDRHRCTREYFDPRVDETSVSDRSVNGDLGWRCRNELSFPHSISCVVDEGGIEDESLLEVFDNENLFFFFC